MKRAPRWTPAEVAKLEELLSHGLSDAEIGQRLGRSDNAVNIARKRHGIPSRHKQLLTSRRVADRLGLGCSKKVAYWIKRGFLRGRRAAGAGRYRMWLVEEDALLAFMEDPRYWHMWTPERVKDSGEREWATEIRKERYLSTGEVGRRLGVVSNAVLSWIQRGCLPAKRWGNWMVKESDLEGFIPPYERSRLGGTAKRFTHDEDHRLLVLRVEGGMSWTQIAGELDRAVSSVFGRYQRLMEEAK
jgi:hypothetical protein